MAIHATYGASIAGDTQRGPSMALWGNCPIQPWLTADPNVGWGFWDDFTDYMLPGTQTTEIALGRYKVMSPASGKIISDSMPHSAAPTTTAQGGIISVLDDTDNDASSIGTQACPFSLSTTLAGKLWFEARIATDSIATATTGFFVGLGENLVATFSTTIPLGDGNATSNTLALVGFNRLEAGLGVLNTSYSDHATSWTDIQASAGAIVAATWIKLGMYFDPSNTTECLQFFVNGVKTTTSMTKAALAALTHLDAKGLGPCFAQCAGASGTTTYGYMDWWGCAQLAL